MIEIPASDSQRRLEAILADPQGYFARARAQAWAEATAEVDNELAARAHQRAHHRRNGRHQDSQPAQRTD